MYTAINKVSIDTGITSRTLRYWEAVGLFKSVRDVQSGWRMYDEHALQNIRVTELLRRLDLSIRDIKEVLDNKTVDSLCHVLQKRLSKLEKTRDDLDILKSVISEIIAEIKSEPQLTLLSLEGILLPVALERRKHVVSKLKGGFSMENVKSKNMYDDIKIIKLPPMRTVAYHCVGTEPEDEAYGMVKDWIVKNSLEGTMRIFGFNTEPYPSGDNPYGFGYCATIPEGIVIPNPLYEKKLPGGLYAVVPDEGGPGSGWKRVHELCNNKEWEWEWDGEKNPGLEEHIDCEGTSGPLIPILFPVRKK
ncbi:MAG: MerR family transcriptional regulator [Defluviitaleaceae bacterium]|nr:MerR family transcriptional regulator [Defluviitaleaceae bacterium]